MSIVKTIQQCVTESLQTLFGQPFAAADFQVNQTLDDFEGDYTVVLFSLVKKLRQAPDALGKQLGDHLVAHHGDVFTSYNIIKGFLNLAIADAYWNAVLQRNYHDICYGTQPMNGQKVMVEYSSPNTNKPLHLGHLRNNFLGWSVAEILKANGYEVIKSCIVNDRGIHICKSMIAWQLFANGATPQSTGTKGDHFVGEYYVKFNDELKAQLKPLLKLVFEDDSLSAFSNADATKIQAHLTTLGQLETHFKNAIDEIEWTEIAKIGFRVETLTNAASDSNIKWKTIPKSIVNENFDTATAEEKEKKEKALQKALKKVIDLEGKMEDEKADVTEIVQNYTAIMKATQQMLLDWEAGKPDVMDLWRTMNGWVYEGFNSTYQRIGSDFDITYYESNTYLLGKETVQQGLAKGVFYQKEDGSVWIDLTADGLDEKLVQRKDGTSVYITQDIGLAQQKYDVYKIDKSLYVIGNEQNYHMKVLQLICKHLGMPYADGIYHLSYGMVELPSGKMKSREGTVVDADDLLDEMLTNAELEAVKNNQGKPESEFNKMTAAEKTALYEIIGPGAMKFYLLRVDPKKTMVFNPEESIEFTGFTGAYVQYAYARIKSILRKQPAPNNWQPVPGDTLLPLEKELLVMAEQYPAIVEQAAAEYSPSVIANYVFHLTKTFNSFYTEHSVTKAESEAKQQLRLCMVALVAHIIQHGMGLLGIRVPERM
jgi:arginyl-tRNA synthetase